MVGRTLGRYRLLEQVGQGGMAVVYRALDVPLDREVAVKVLHPHLTDHEEARARLKREAQAVAKLHHENILEIFASSGPDEEACYLVTEFIHGETLRAFLNDHPLPLPEVGAMLVEQVAQALASAHAVGIIHRDIKPENVMIRRGGGVVLCDFGIAQVIDKDRMTATGQLLGSPAYMAPEHIEGRPLDPRSDIFSLGVLLYQLVTSELPFRGRNPHETLKKISDGQYTPPEELQPLCGAPLRRVVRRALCREPAGRYGDVGAMRDDLLGALRESGVTEPRAELRDFFTDPEGWEAAGRPRIGRALCQAGLALRAAGRTAAALEAWGRAQLLLPDDPEVAALIRGVSRRSRLRRAGAAALVSASVFGAAAGGYLGLRGRGRPSDVPGAAVTAGPAGRATRSGSPERVGAPSLPSQAPTGPSRAPTGPSRAPTDPSRAPTGLSQAPGVPPSARLEPPAPFGPPDPPPAIVRLPTAKRRDALRRPASVAVRPPRPGRPEPAAAVARRVVQLAPPKAVQVSLNGKPLGAYGTDVTNVELPPGPSELVFENPACYPERVVIPADADPGAVRVRLRWKPAQLLVRAAGGPRDVDIVVEGRLGRVGQPLYLPMRGEDGHSTVELKASAPGYRTLSRAVDLRANQLTTLDISLEPG